MGFDQPNCMHSSLFWIPRTPPTMSRYNYNKNCGALILHKQHGGASTLNRNFGSTALPSTNRYPIGHVRNVFNYSPTNPNYRSNCLAIIPSKNHFDYLPKYKPGNNGYTFGSQSLSHATAPAYNTVHKSIDDVIYDATAEVYEDLDCYERPPLENSTPTYSEQKTASSSSQYHVSKFQIT